jgi:tRNA dimethylallyltransferase
MNKIIVIIGPTGSGKTDLALYLSKKINGEIINADAFQVYKEIPIGTNAYVPKKNEPKIHLNNCLSIYKV